MNFSALYGFYDCSMCMLRWWCSLSMPKIIYCPVHMTIGGKGLSMPTDGCTVCMLIMFINYKF